MKYWILVVIYCWPFGSLCSQSVDVWTSLDTILLGNQVQVQYKAQDLGCELEVALQGLPVVAGPSHSRSISIVNGQRSSETVIGFTLRPDEVGVLNLPLATCSKKDSIHQDQTTIVVIDNPDGIKQQVRPNPPVDVYPKRKSRPKRRLRKI